MSLADRRGYWHVIEKEWMLASGAKYFMSFRAALFSQTWFLLPLPVMLESPDSSALALSKIFK